jgi:hypothetical protein
MGGIRTPVGSDSPAALAVARGSGWFQSRMAVIVSPKRVAVDVDRAEAVVERGRVWVTALGQVVAGGDAIEFEGQGLE